MMAAAAGLAEVALQTTLAKVVVDGRRRIAEKTPEATNAAAVARDDAAVDTQRTVPAVLGVDG